MSPGLKVGGGQMETTTNDGPSNKIPLLPGSGFLTSEVTITETDSCHLKKCVLNITHANILLTET